jgi:hypothetical protein
MLPLERDAVASTIRSSPNLNVAAERLGASRKTLYNRMREFSLPAGKSGRPRVELPHQVGSALPYALGALALVGLGYAWWRAGKTSVQGEVARSIARGTRVLAGLE